MSHALISDLILPAFDNPELRRLADAASLSIGGSMLAFTTDAYVVDPLFFSGGDIGTLAINGTINDLAVSGATPVAISASFILEEGLPVETLQRILGSMQSAASAAGVQIVTGDTKVVPRGKADKLFIVTSGIGRTPPSVRLGKERIATGDRVIVSGTIGDHGIAVLVAREAFALSGEVSSDCAPLHELCATILESGGDGVKIMRDPTRGGLASTLNEFVQDSGAGICIDEARVPVRREVRAACDLLGFDPMHIANEGKVVVVVSPDRAAGVLQTMRQHPLGREAADIGEITTERPGSVTLRTTLGALRFVDLPMGELLPRIC
jgi:hydrogenase expression/formation protein HypE